MALYHPVPNEPPHSDDDIERQYRIRDGEPEWESGLTGLEWLGCGLMLLFCAVAMLGGVAWACTWAWGLLS